MPDGDRVRQNPPEAPKPDPERSAGRTAAGAAVGLARRPLIAYVVATIAIILSLAGFATAQVMRTTVTVTAPARVLEVRLDGEVLGTLTIPAHSVTQTVDVPAPTTTGWDGVLTAIPVLPFTAKRTVTVGDGAELRAAIAGLRAGDLVRAAEPFTVTGPTVRIQARLAEPARLDLHGVTIQTGAAGTLQHGVVVVGAENVQVVGGDVSTPGNAGISIQDSVNFSWRDVDVHDTAGIGIIVQGVNRPQAGIDLEARVWRAGLEPERLDPHMEAGTGVHAVYLGGADYPTSGRFVFDVHDQAYGAAVQAGAHLVDSALWIRAARITFKASIQVGGNALQLWGSVRNLQVHHLEAEDLAGRAVETDGLYGNASGIVVDYARVTRTRLTPAYATHRAVVYHDVR